MTVIVNRTLLRWFAIVGLVLAVAAPAIPANVPGKVSLKARA